MKQKLMAVALLVVAFTGCDNQGSRRDDGERPSERQAANDRPSAERSALAAGLDKYAEGKLKLFDDSLKDVADKLVEARSDAAVLSKMVADVAAERNSKGEELDSENQLLRLMKNAEICRLALKYLASDFSHEVAPYVEKIKIARTQENRYNAEIKLADAQYREIVDQASKWTNASKEQRDQEIRRLRLELNRLETRRIDENKNFAKQGKRALSGGALKERERYEAKDALERRIADIDSQIAKKRDQLDYLTNPNANRRIESASAISATHTQERAATLKRRINDDLERFKPKVRVIDVVEEYSKRTVGALRDKLTGKVDELSKCEQSLKASIIKIKDIRLSIPVSTAAELKEIRTALEKIK